MGAVIAAIGSCCWCSAPSLHRRHDREDIDDRMRSRVTGARLAIGFGVSSIVVAMPARR